jgi:hypothetical protein
MPEPTMRDIERLILKLGTKIAKLEVSIGQVAAQCSALPLITSQLEELTQACDHTRELVDNLNQVTTGVRSLGESTYDLQRATSRRLSVLVNALVESGVIPFEALREELQSNVPPAPEVPLAQDAKHD